MKRRHEPDVQRRAREHLGPVGSKALRGGRRRARGDFARGHRDIAVKHVDQHGLVKLHPERVFVSAGLKRRRLPSVVRPGQESVRLAHRKFTEAVPNSHNRSARPGHPDGFLETHEDGFNSGFGMGPPGGTGSRARCSSSAARRLRKNMPSAQPQQPQSAGANVHPPFITSKDPAAQVVSAGAIIFCLSDAERSCERYVSRSRSQCSITLPRGGTGGRRADGAAGGDLAGQTACCSSTSCSRSGPSAMRRNFDRRRLARVNGLAPGSGQNQRRTMVCSRGV
jgi:hypothetical protein